MLFQLPPSPQILGAESFKPEGAMIASTHQVLMQTATVTVKNRKHNSSASVCLVLDSGYERSYITEKLARVLKLTLDRTEKLSVVTFGSSRIKSIDCKQGRLIFFLERWQHYDNVYYSSPEYFWED